MVKLPRKAGRDQDKQLPPTESPHSTEGTEPRTFKIPAPHTEAKADNLDNQVHKEGEPSQSPSCLQLWPMTAVPTTLVSRSADLVKEWELSSGPKSAIQLAKEPDFFLGPSQLPCVVWEQQQREPCSFQVAAAADFPTRH